MESEIVKLEEELRKAMITSDVQKLDELIDNSLVFVSPYGCVVTKQMDLDAHKSGMQKIKNLVPSEQTVEIRDNFAIVTVKMSLTGAYNEMDITGNFRYLRLWQKTNDGWKIVAGTVSEIKYD